MDRWGGGGGVLVAVPAINPCDFNCQYFCSFSLYIYADRNMNADNVVQVQSILHYTLRSWSFNISRAPKQNILYVRLTTYVCVPSTRIFTYIKNTNVILLYSISLGVSAKKVKIS
jgi:hypothetical protein